MSLLNDLNHRLLRRLTILGAASNVIVIQHAEKRSGATLTFLEFVRIGLPLTVVNVAVYWLFLMMSWGSG